MLRAPRGNIDLRRPGQGGLENRLGASLVFNVSSVLLSRILGIFLIGYVVYLFVKSSFRIKPTLWAGACGGALSGFLAGIFGIGGAVRGVFLPAFGLPGESPPTSQGLSPRRPGWGVGRALARGRDAQEPSRRNTGRRRGATPAGAASPDIS